MKRSISITAILLAIAVPAFSQSADGAAEHAFASDFQTIPVMANTTGVGGRFETYVSILNPTLSPIAVEATLYDAAGTARNATFTLGAREQRTFPNFLANIFNYAGGGAVTLRSPSTFGANRFVVTTEIRSGRYGTSIPAVEFAPSNSPSFAPGITVDASARTNIGCFNQSPADNTIRATIRDGSGQTPLGTIDLFLPANAWGQTSVGTIVVNGYVVFEPSEPAICYAVVVDNSTNDGRFITAAEYRP